MAKKRDPRIIDIEKPYTERERKYVPAIPAAIAAQGDTAVAAYKSEQLLKIAETVRLCRDVFVTADHPDMAPVIPAALQTEKFAAPAERTKPRERIYYADMDLKVRDHGAEFRQEMNKRYGVKQTIKITLDHDVDNPTLNRAEMHAKLTGPGVCLEAASDDRHRAWLKKTFRENALKPAFRMVSQRIRIPYHPEGDMDVMIELACDNILFGETMFGRTWQDPKLEIEIVKGPADEDACRKILEREERRLQEQCALLAQRPSNAKIGYGYLEADLQGGQARGRFAKMQPATCWWNRAGRARLGLA